MPTWDEPKRLRNIKNHGLDFVGCEAVFDGPVVTWEDAREAYGKQRISLLGWLEGIVVHMTYTERGDEPHIISLPVRAARQQLAASRGGGAVDSRLSFQSARALFADLTPARVDLLDTLRRVGPCSVYALSKAAGRNYSNVHTDVARLEVLGLVERTDEGSVSVPYEAVEILVPLAQAA